MASRARAPAMMPSVVCVPRPIQRAPYPANAPIAMPDNGNRKPAHNQNPYTSPEPTRAPINAPNMPRPMLKSFDGALGAVDNGCSWEIGRGACGNGGGAAGAAGAA